MDETYQLGVSDKALLVLLFLLLALPFPFLFPSFSLPFHFLVTSRVRGQENVCHGYLRWHRYQPPQRISTKLSSKWCQSMRKLLLWGRSGIDIDIGITTLMHALTLHQTNATDHRAQLT